MAAAQNYNYPMRLQRLFCALTLLACGASILPPAASVQAAPAQAVTAYDLIIAMNTLRVSYGLPALIEDPIIDAVAQATAQTMAVNNMSWHIGNVRGRIAAAGYGGGATVWATENFAVGHGDGMGIDQIMAVWADPDHMRPAVDAAYCNVGAGVAEYNGKTYYILQAAYVSGQACGSITSSPGGGTTGGTTTGGTGGVPQIIVPVKLATPDAEGKVYHTVQAGQSLWAIAIAYQVTIQDLETWNNISRNIPLQAGQKLFIPDKNTPGFATPTPKGMVITQTPDVTGRIVHEVQPYQSLITIAEAYQVPIDRLLALNGWQSDWPLQIGQQLLISPGNVTPTATLLPIQRLTPAADGNYYHTVQSGETLSGIANTYGIPLADLLNWNGLNAASVIRPDQPLLLLILPPSTVTPTPTPATLTPTLTPSLTSRPHFISPTPGGPPATATDDSAPRSMLFLMVGVLVILGAGTVGWFAKQMKTKGNDSTS